VSKILNLFFAVLAAHDKTVLGLSYLLEPTVSLFKSKKTNLAHGYIYYKIPQVGFQQVCSVPHVLCICDFM